MEADLTGAKQACGRNDEPPDLLASEVLLEWHVPGGKRIHLSLDHTDRGGH
jgi:hypothetical protein